MNPASGQPAPEPSAPPKPDAKQLQDALAEKNTGKRELDAASKAEPEAKAKTAAAAAPADLPPVLCNVVSITSRTVIATLHAIFVRP